MVLTRHGKLQVMPLYRVKITQTSVSEVFVSADSPAEAEEIVSSSDIRAKEEIVDTEFTAVPTSARSTVGEYLLVGVNEWQEP